MAARVTMSEVREIIDTSLSDAGVSSCITAANSLIASKADMTSLLSEDTLTQIELWLSAHYVSVADPRVSEERTRETSVKYVQPSAGTGLGGSSYGQTAIALDSTLSLSEGPAVKRATIKIL